VSRLVLRKRKMSPRVKLCRRRRQAQLQPRKAVPSDRWDHPSHHPVSVFGQRQISSVVTIRVFQNSKPFYLLILLGLLITCRC